MSAPQKSDFPEERKDALAPSVLDKREFPWSPPPLRIEGGPRPQREAHFDPCATGRVRVTIWEWHPIMGKDGGERVCLGWYSRSESFTIALDLARTAAATWAATRCRCVWTAHEKDGGEGLLEFGVVVA